MIDFLIFLFILLTVVLTVLIFLGSYFSEKLNKILTPLYYIGSFSMLMVITLIIGKIYTL